MTSLPAHALDGIPPQLGRYEVRAKIGDGGMATVYLGRHAPEVDLPPPSRLVPRLVALKVIRQEYCKHPEFVTMFLDEAKIMSRLSHPNLVDVVELGSEGDRHFIAMELLVGQSLWQVWNACRARGVRLRYDLTAWIGARVAEGLHHAHEMRDSDGQPQMLVHRDVNQSNIFLTYDGQVKIIDFGLAKAKGRVYETAGGVVKGKIAYLAPEQVGGQPIDRRADVFALGTTLWEVATDRRLFRAKDDAETLQRIHTADVPDPVSLVQGFPPALSQILRRALARAPGDRFATALDFARSLDGFSRSEGRVVEPRTLGDVMRELFSEEYSRDQEWLTEASAPDHGSGLPRLADRPAPHVVMHAPPPLTLPPPPSRQPGEILPLAHTPGDVPPPSGWPRGAPPDGMFSPASSQPGDAVPAAAIPAAARLERASVWERPDSTSRSSAPVTSAGRRGSPVGGESTGRSPLLWVGVGVAVLVAGALAALLLGR